MSTIKCPECQKEISNTSISCPNCGCPITSSTRTLEQGTIPQAEIYKTAFIHSIIIAIVSIVIKIIIDIRAAIVIAPDIIHSEGIFWFWKTPSDAFYPIRKYIEFYYALNINVILIVLFIVVGILWLMKYSKLNVKTLSAYKTAFIMWGSYAIIHNTFDIYYILDYNDFLCWFLCLAPILIIIGLLLYVKFKMKLKIEFRKHYTIFIIWGIYALLNVVPILIPHYGGFYTFTSITIVIISIVIGIMWGISRSKSKTIQ